MACLLASKELEGSKWVRAEEGGGGGSGSGSDLFLMVCLAKLHLFFLLSLPDLEAEPLEGGPSFLAPKSRLRKPMAQLIGYGFGEEE